jgi:hypothetical protein
MPFRFAFVRGNSSHHSGVAKLIRKKYLLLVLAVAAVCLQAADYRTVNSGIINSCLSTVNVNSAAVVLVCPLGDGDALNAAVGGVNGTITLTVKDNTNTGIANIPAVDMWLVGCNDGLLLCGSSSGSSPDGPTNASGTTTFSNEPVAGGCDTGVYAVVQGWVVQNPGSCTPKCLSVATRSPDYKSAGAPGPPGCAGDIRCPDSRVSLADYNWFSTHYPTSGNPGAPYFACADYAAPLGTVTLADYSKFSIHYAGVGHKCPI